MLLVLGSQAHFLQTFRGSLLVFFIYDANDRTVFRSKIPQNSSTMYGLGHKKLIRYFKIEAHLEMMKVSEFEN